ncbi:DUF4476 domain-containing protein [Flavobacterium sp. JP2137]|uniref:DUF4476 domain-containing protein n=1 Tax=Flavobacterium sp. JP2137 TaxID=3414510 RepID=UPI003D2FC896
MKKTLTLAFIFSSAMLLAQEAGKKGELLKNEANSREVQIQRPPSNGRNNTIEYSGNRRDGENGSGRNSTSTSSSRERVTSPRYNWHQNQGYSEVFLRIPEGGFFTVEIGNQTISNASGKFRFFDLSSGKMPLSIYEDGFLVYRSQIQVRNDSRLVLDYFTNYGLYLLDSYPVRGQQYGFNQWDDIWNTPYDNGQWQTGNSHTPAIMDPASFENFLQNMKKSAHFDKDKLAFIKQQAAVSMFSSQQIKTLLKAFSFDEQKVEAGKALYPRCSDPVNFYQVYDSFDFEKGKKKLMNYVSSLR